MDIDYMEFKTREEAKIEIATMGGWDIKCEHRRLYDANSNMDYFAWVIAAREIGTRSDWKYLRKDGYVR